MEYKPTDNPLNDYDGSTIGALRMATFLLSYIKQAYNERILIFVGTDEKERQFRDTLDRVGEVCLRKVDQEEEKMGLKKPSDESLH